MNIFYLDTSPIISARYLCDFHIRKMGIESAQMLANCLTKQELEKAPPSQSSKVRKWSYFNHPSSVWVRSSYQNAEWLIAHAQEIFKEYRYRFDKIHFTEDFVSWVSRKMLFLQKDYFEEPPQCMPDVYKHEDPVIAYRRYYTFEKAKKPNFTYTKRKQPEWLNESLHEIALCK